MTCDSARRRALEARLYRIISNTLSSSSKFPGSGCDCGGAGGVGVGVGME